MTQKSEAHISRFTLCVIALFFVSVAATLAQDAPPRDIEDLQQLVAPIALYPDALLAQVLASSTYPDDVMAAAHWLDAGNNPQGIDAQPWDSSVKGVARYPSVLHYMATNADWMNDIGDAFLHQQGDVMSAVQNLRAEAVAAGTLVNTPQQTVINQDGYIQIIPTNPQTLYAPIYDPQAVYNPQPYDAGQAYTPYITFGAGVDVGDWLDFDLDWYDRSIYFGHWGRDRPWWHDRDHVGLRYINDRTGQFKDMGGHPPDWRGAHWTRDDHRSAPRPVNRGTAHAALARPDRGYPERTAPGLRAAEPTFNRGADVARQSERGQASRQRAAPPAPEVIRPAPEPVREAPIRSEPRPAAPEPRQSAPSGGGAMRGYQGGQEAGQSSARGAQSRGGGGGGGARGGGGGGRR
jgi:uncharacterized membrane protein YgcG